MLSAIAIIGKNREIGKENGLIFNVPGDLVRFKQITTGHPIIMGRKTFESIGRPLPNRTNIVISRSMSDRSGIVVVASLEEAVLVATRSPGAEETFVIGGGQVFAQAMLQVSRLYLTLVEASDEDADSFFPDFSDFTKIVSAEDHEEKGVKFRYLTLERV